MVQAKGKDGMRSSSQTVSAAASQRSADFCVNTRRACWPCCTVCIHRRTGVAATKFFPKASTKGGESTDLGVVRQPRSRGSLGPWAHRLSGRATIVGRCAVAAWRCAITSPARPARAGPHG